MAKLLSDYEFRKLVDTDDPFRLAVRGHAALEAVVGAGLREALGPDELPKVIRQASLPLRLELARRLGLISEHGSRGLAELGKLRHLFAHGDLDDSVPLRTLLDWLMPCVRSSTSSTRTSVADRRRCPSRLC